MARKRKTKDDGAAIALGLLALLWLFTRKPEKQSGVIIDVEATDPARGAAGGTSAHGEAL